MKPAYIEAEVRLPWYQRLVLVFVGSGLLALLAIAACLRPDPRGFGTHQQLGLRPCTISEVFGIRCPSCGMTTSWCHLMHGELRESLRANVGGTLLALLALAFGPWAVASGLRGWWLGRSPNEVFVAVLVVVVVIITMIDWSLRLLLR